MNKAALLVCVGPVALLAGEPAVAQQLQGSDSQVSGTSSTAAANSGTGTPASVKGSDPQSPGNTPANAAANQSSGALGDIIVTAQRQSENLQKTAVSVDAVTGAGLVANQVTNSVGLSKLVPGLSVAPAGGGSFFYFVRGIGNFTTDPFADPAIAFNIDDVYVGRTIATTEPFYDLERIEVVKGPQGTLYGRNATGGAINVVPVKPKLGEFGGYVSGEYGNYNTYDVQGAINAPLGEHAALRISGDVVGHDGYLSDGEDDQKSRSVRVQLAGDLTPNLHARLSADYAHVGGVGQGSTYTDRFTLNPATGAYVVTPSGLSSRTGIYDPASQAFLQQSFVPQAGRTLGPVAPRAYADNNIYGVDGQVNYDSTIGKLTVIAAYRPTDVNFVQALSGSIAGTREHDHQFSTEVRFAGNRIGIFDYTLGGLYYHEHQQGTFAAGLQIYGGYTNYDTSTTSYAGFGRLTAHLTDKLRLVGGVRYTHDHKDFQGSLDRLVVLCAVVVNGVPSCPSAPLVPFSFSPTDQNVVPVPPLSAGPGPSLVPIGMTGALAVRLPLFALNDELSKGRVTWRGAAEYDLGPQSLAYASVETGYRSGGFSLAQGFDHYDPEYITAYTIGSKNRFFDRRLELNVELFYWRYRNQQVSHLGLDLSGQNANFIQNIGRSTNKGAEVEARVLATKNTELSANVQYLNAKYNSYIYQTPISGGAPFTGCSVTPTAANPNLGNVDCSGKAAYNAPKWTINAAVQQTVRVGGLNLVGSVSTQYLGKRYISFGFTPDELAPGTWTGGVNLSLSPDGAAWEVSAYVLNIGDNRYAVNATQNPLTGITATSHSAPLLFGGRVSFKF